MSLLIIIGIIISHVLLAQSSYNVDNDSSVDIFTCRKYFSHDAWAVVCNVVDIVRKNPIYYCGRCTCPIANDKHQSIACDCCLTWFHFICLSMTMLPKAKVWICKGCLAM